MKTLPKIKDLNAEYAQVLAEKKKAYTGYREAREKMQEYAKAQKNVEMFLQKEEVSKTAEQKNQPSR